MTQEEFSKRTLVSKFSLSAEELSLVLSMVGQPEQGQAILKTAHENLVRLDMDSLLSSASHSLLARGFSKISTAGQPILEKNLEKASTVLIQFDQLIYLNIVSGSRPLELTIHVKSPKAFCSHLNKANVVHVLEYGQFRDLGKYLIYILGESIISSTSTSDHFEAPIPFSILPTSLELHKNQMQISISLTNAGWPSDRADMLAEDLIRKIVRGSLIRINSGNLTSEEQIAKAPRSGLLFLRGLQRSWVFKFPSMEPSAIGQARLVDLDTFEQFLIGFVK